MASRRAVTTPEAAWIHATAVVIGGVGILIRGPSGVGKSSLAQHLLVQAPHHRLFARLVGDDRLQLHARNGRLVASGHSEIAGLLERRTQPFARLPHEPRCVVGLVVDLIPATSPLPRWCEDTGEITIIAGVDSLPLLRLQGPASALSCEFVIERVALAQARPASLELFHLPIG